VKKSFWKLTKAINICTGIVLAIMVFIIFLQVIMRYVLGHSLSTSEELTRYMFVFVLYLSVNLGIKGDNQIKIDVMDLQLHGTALKILKIVQYVLSAIAVIAAMVGSFYLIKTGKMAITPSLHLPMWIVYLVFPVGFALDLIELFIKISCIISDKKEEVQA